MNRPGTLHEILYVSTLAPHAPLSEVGAIARHARIRNPPVSITGLLVFDGIRFCQCLEGGLKRVVELYERIVVDTRHVSVTLIHSGPIASRKFKTFSMAFADVIDEEVLGNLEKLSGISAVNGFDDMCRELDPL